MMGLRTYREIDHSDAMARALTGRRLSLSLSLYTCCMCVHVNIHVREYYIYIYTYMHECASGFIDSNWSIYPHIERVKAG